MVDEQSAEPVFDDPQFRQKRKHGRYRVVDAPQLEGPVADTHAHLQLLPDPSYALARCAAHKVEFVCTIVDVFEDGTTTMVQTNSTIVVVRSLELVAVRGRCGCQALRRLDLKRPLPARAAGSDRRRVPPA